MFKISNKNKLRMYGKVSFFKFYNLSSNNNKNEIKNENKNENYYFDDFV